MESQIRFSALSDTNEELVYFQFASEKFSKRMDVVSHSFERMFKELILQPEKLAKFAKIKYSRQEPNSENAFVEEG